MDKKYVIVDAQFHHIPPEAGKKIEGKAYEAEDAKQLAARVKDPGRKAARDRYFGIENCLRHMEDCGVDMALVGNSGWIVGGLDICKVVTYKIQHLLMGVQPTDSGRQCKTHLASP